MADKINPYIAGAPVVEQRMFFGREDVFSWIERSLSGKFVDHILVLHGQRRVGKTSVLKHLPNRLPDRYAPLADGDRIQVRGAPIFTTLRYRPSPDGCAESEMLEIPAS